MEFLCKAYGQSQVAIKELIEPSYSKQTPARKSVSFMMVNKDPVQTLKDIEKTKQIFKALAVQGRLPKPLVNGHDLKALGFKEGKVMAHKLEKLYELQLEQNIKSKKKLLKKAL